MHDTCKQFATTRIAAQIGYHRYIQREIERACVERVLSTRTCESHVQMVTLAQSLEHT